MRPRPPTLKQAVNLFGELSSHLSQGEQFYNNLSRHLMVTKQKISDYVYSRSIEANELLSSLGGGASGGRSYYPS